MTSACSKPKASSSRHEVGKPCGKTNTRSTTKVNACVAVLVVIFLIDSGLGDSMWGAQVVSPEFLLKFRWNFIEWASYISAASIALCCYFFSRKGTKKNLAVKRSSSKMCNIDTQPMCTGKLASATSFSPQKWRVSIEQAAQMGDAELAQKLFKDMEQTDCRMDAVIPNIVMRAFTKKGDLVGAECWLSEMKSKGMEISACTYNIILDACAKSNKPDLCGKWVSRMTEDGVSPTAVTYATLIALHARQGNEGNSEILFNRMKAGGIVPDEVCFNSMIHACSIRGNFNGVARWVDEMTQAGLQPSVTTFTAAIDACAKKGKIEEAESWMNRMIVAGLQPNVVSYSSLMDACAKIGKPERAGFWYDEMLKVGVKPNSYTFSAAISACSKAGDVAAAEAWLARAQDSNAEVASDPVIYSGVIDACAKTNDADRAWRVFEQMRARGVRPHIVIYATLARPFAHHGNYQKVEELRHMMDAEGVAVNEYFLYAQLVAYGRARPRQVVKARDAFRMGLAQGLQINERVLDALRRAVGRDHAIALHEEAKVARRDSPETVADKIP